MSDAAPLHLYRLDKELEANYLRPGPGKQYCEQGKHYVPRVPYVTRKGWMCDECRRAMAQ